MEYVVLKHLCIVFANQYQMYRKVAISFRWHNKWYYYSEMDGYDVSINYDAIVEHS